ncbi:hypothetical protein GPECTOR_52g42 [Gonium pectorale]|uniref:Uncharacterized protein n=1 Tax=Gonium pectorale TaxID=33097 RepID=A0A150G716_GONPE|nr:hypothetical protein GPECTOR_52g42 [Gonium pectorale]|eukprot:KXZ45642.1 hypothetical protein GPECTOR_52g42 [Gonium pectorale]
MDADFGRLSVSVSRGGGLVEAMAQSSIPAAAASRPSLFSARAGVVSGGKAAGLAAGHPPPLHPLAERMLSWAEQAAANRSNLEAAGGGMAAGGRVMGGGGGLAGGLMERIQERLDKVSKALPGDWSMQLRQQVMRLVGGRRRSAGGAFGDGGNGDANGSLDGALGELLPLAVRRFLVCRTDLYLCYNLYFRVEPSANTDTSGINSAGGEGGDGGGGGGSGGGAMGQSAPSDDEVGGGRAGGGWLRGGGGGGSGPGFGNWPGGGLRGGRGDFRGWLASFEGAMRQAYAGRTQRAATRFAAMQSEVDAAVASLEARYPAMAAQAGLLRRALNARLYAAAYRSAALAYSSAYLDAVIGLALYGTNELAINPRYIITRLLLIVLDGAIATSLIGLTQATFTVTPNFVGGVIANPEGGNTTGVNTTLPGGGPLNGGDLLEGGGFSNAILDSIGVLQRRRRGNRLTPVTADDLPILSRLTRNTSQATETAGLRDGDGDSGGWGLAARLREEDGAGLGGGVSGMFRTAGGAAASNASWGPGWTPSGLQAPWLDVGEAVVAALRSELLRTTVGAAGDGDEGGDGGGALDPGARVRGAVQAYNGRLRELLSRVQSAVLAGLQVASVGPAVGAALSAQDRMSSALDAREAALRRAASALANRTGPGAVGSQVLAAMNATKVMAILDAKPPSELERWDMWTWDEYRVCRAASVQAGSDSSPGEDMLTTDRPCSWRLAYVCAEESAVLAAGFTSSTAWYRTHFLGSASGPEPSPYALGPGASGLTLVRSGLLLGDPNPPQDITIAFNDTEAFWQHGPVVSALYRFAGPES